MRRRHQSVSLIQRGKDPKWIIKFYEDRDGKRIRRTVTLGFVREISPRRAHAMATPYYAAADNAVPPKPKTGVTVKDAVQLLRQTASLSLKPTSQRAAESHLKHHVLPRLGDGRLAETTTAKL
jgi:hypothetical protein